MTDASLSPTEAAALRLMIDAGRAAWPDVQLQDEVFSAYLAARVEGGQLSSIRAADAWLACGCVLGLPSALKAFDDVYLRRLGTALARNGSKPDTITEVLQRLRVQLLMASPGEDPAIATFQARSDLHAWLRVVAMREAARVDKAKHQEVPVPDEELLVQLAATDPELGYLKALYRREVVLAMGAALEALPAKERQLLRHHLVDGLNIDELGSLFQVHRATAARWLEAAREQLSDGVRSRLVDKLGVAPAELDEILQLVRSRLDVSVRSLLRAPQR